MAGSLAEDSNWAPCTKTVAAMQSCFVIVVVVVDDDGDVTYDKIHFLDYKN
jgi:hypothetical protein